MMNCIRQLLATPDLVVSRFDHPPHITHRDPRGETSPTYSINFVENGAFDLAVAGRCWRVTSGDVFLARPGLRYRCRHQEECPSDVCLSIDYGGSLAEASSNGVVLSRIPLIFKTSNRLAYLTLRLRRSLERSQARSGEAIAIALWNAVIDSAQTQHQRRYTRSQLVWYAERLEGICTFLESDYSASHSLASLARSVGMSTFHFVRIFRELTGTPPHRYLLNVRLEKALERLREGSTVTETCFAVGFNNLSHFHRSFRRHFGVAPSKWRSIPRRLN